MLLVVLVAALLGLGAQAAYARTCLPTCVGWPRQVMPVGGPDGFCVCVSTPDR